MNKYIVVEENGKIISMKKLKEYEDYPSARGIGEPPLSPPDYPDSPLDHMTDEDLALYGITVDDDVDEWGDPVYMKDGNPLSEEDVVAIISNE